MEYSTAIALKNAGFPQGEHTPLSIPRMQIEEVEESYVKFPTTDDLIAELGEDFESLVLMNDNNEKWFQAYPTDEAYTGDCVVDCCGYETGKTPVEALANLYIELHSKA